MSDTENKIPEWAIVEARERLNKSWSKAYPHRRPITFAPHAVTPLAEMIAKHEQPPVDKYDRVLVRVFNKRANVCWSLGKWRTYYGERWATMKQVLKESLENES